MIHIKKFTIEGLSSHIVSDSITPLLEFFCESDTNSTLTKIHISVSNGFEVDLDPCVSYRLKGVLFEPYQKYEVTLKVLDDQGNEDKKTLIYEFGKGNDPWIGKWITDSEYQFTEKRIDPKVMLFRKKLSFTKPVKEAKLYVTALGVYRLEVDKKRVNEAFLKPGFTSYAHNLMYQVYPLNLHGQNHDLDIYVAGGWAVGSFIYSRVNRHYAKRQALLAELRVQYEDGSSEVIPSDESWLVTTENKYKLASLYDGETLDANVNELQFHQAHFETVKIKPKIVADYSSDIKVKMEMRPISMKSMNGKTLYDFGQNLTGIISLHIKEAKQGDIIIVKHAEVLQKDGDLDLSLLRSAKATLTYVCKEGEQDYTPEFTYMGFRYITIEGIDPSKVEVKALHLTSEMDEVSSFHCSDKMLNQLQSNIVWSGRNNFEDIPTDCPQRDERMGWTGDISIFAPTALFNFDCDRFLKKWLVDVKSEQRKGGSIPVTVPIHGYGLPYTMPPLAVDFWGDCILTVPYAIYQNTGEKEVLETYYDSMKRYVEAEHFWAKIWGVGKYRYIWHTPSMLHFGDWVSPEVDKMSEWQKRSKYTATASLKRCASLLSEVASILGKKEDEKKYSELASKVKDAYVSVFTENGKLKKKEFQTGYVLPLAFDMFEGTDKENALKNLVKLIEDNHYCIGTGFPGTPYILFVLADNGYEDVAFKMLMNTEAPSWLYNVKVGGTTIWEKFDGMLEDGTCRPSKDGTGNMVSFDHYASGSVGEFLYTRIGGLRILEPGYKKFEVKPILGPLTSLEESTVTPYGKIEIKWKRENDDFTLEILVPMLTSCKAVLPDGSQKELSSGRHILTCKL